MPAVRRSGGIGVFPNSRIVMSNKHAATMGAARVSGLAWMQVRRYLALAKMWEPPEWDRSK